MDTQSNGLGGTFIRIKILQLPARVRDTYMLIMIFIEYKKKKSVDDNIYNCSRDYYIFINK
jgi:hypothetical protein